MMQDYELKVSVKLPKEEMDKILSLSQGILRQIFFQGIFEQLFRGAIKPVSLDISEVEDDERVRT